ncbi:hypothetical protein DSM104299_00498 [Baekduia alba]|uniref:gamma-glutamyl-gamma-aminobutyrate hydrolase family protein n=1 Tax=Baekduia alba TaxID=2997333 RepID=UPI0023411A76|nr:gamma-glutamyl-gamma-aminobutyrate hydrolase family protein [Baekduia alba]WCB91820.1 hypothetical protein DSM104299_00498 [Baekduia alba]
MDAIHMKFGAPPKVALLSAQRVPLQPDQVGEVFGASYLRLMEDYGLRPVLVPTLLPRFIEDYVAEVDGAVIAGVEWGGPDPSPARWGERYGAQAHVDEKTENYIGTFATAMLASNRPVLGISYGAEVLASLFGSTLESTTGHAPVDQPGLVRTYIQPAQSARYYDGAGLPVRCMHGWAIKHLGLQLAAEAVSVPTSSSPQVIEAFRLNHSVARLLGVNYHPDRPDPESGLHGDPFVAQFAEWCRDAARIS